MSKAVVVYWKDIPTQVIVGTGHTAVKRQLADRFRLAVDQAARQPRATDTDEYLEHWRKLPTEAPGNDPEAAADALVAELEADYPDTRLADLARHGGHEPF